ncbi:hypothetical protein [Streptomyces lydicus]|uniref:hypothetical protein n=1 Tax=Streptomyces lydicus TaxID=47763 RepID=UPI0036E054FE
MIRSASIAPSSHGASATSAPSAGDRRRSSSSAPARMFANGRRPDSQPCSVSTSTPRASANTACVHGIDSRTRRSTNPLTTPADVRRGLPIPACSPVALRTETRTHGQSYRIPAALPSGCSRRPTNETVPPATTRPGEASMSSTHLVLHDPEACLEAELPLDRELRNALVKAVLGWTGNPSCRMRT